MPDNQVIDSITLLVEFAADASLTDFTARRVVEYSQPFEPMSYAGDVQVLRQFAQIELAATELTAALNDGHPNGVTVVDYRESERMDSVTLYLVTSFRPDHNGWVPVLEASFGSSEASPAFADKMASHLSAQDSTVRVAQMVLSREMIAALFVEKINLTGGRSFIQTQTDGIVF